MTLLPYAFAVMEPVSAISAIIAIVRGVRFAQHTAESKKKLGELAVAWEALGSSVKKVKDLLERDCLQDDQQLRIACTNQIFAQLRLDLPS